MWQGPKVCEAERLEVDGFPEEVDVASFQLHATNCEIAFGTPA